MPDFRVLIMRCVSVDAVPVLAAILLLIVPLDVFAQEAFPMVSVTENADGETEYSLTLQVLLLMTVLTLLPSFLIMMTSFVRIIIVLSLLRQAIGTAQTPAQPGTDRHRSVPEYLYHEPGSCRLFMMTL